MTMHPFNDGWAFSRIGDAAAASVTLPHDAMIGEPRSRAGGTGTHGGFFPGGRYLYAKTWTVPEGSDGRSLALFFEGVYGATTVRVDGVEVVSSISGYREFAAPMDGIVAGQEIRIEVEVDNSKVPNSRWYTGSGIYRKVWLDDAPAQHIVRDGVAIRTARAGGSATATLDVEVGGPASGLDLVATLTAPDGREFTAEGEVEGGRVKLNVTVEEPRLWSAETPHLYRLDLELRGGATVLDEHTTTVGLRTVEVDARYGLRINGDEVLLRGACVHHDSGILGAATFRDAEFRRARILKAAGFNAVRSSHNPMSRDFLDACDRVGLYVLDELTDLWFQPKTAHDVAPQFDELWRGDTISMVAKDRHHPSVIMYSTGNEIAESGSERGIEAARAISELIHELDPDRPTTFALNFLLNVMAASGRSPFDTTEHAPPEEDEKASAITSTAANAMANKIGGMMQLVAKLPKADKVSKHTFTTVDVAGYNYAWGRYKGDAKRYRDRVVLGTESMPGDIPKIWELVTSLPNVIGDFTWTGWDYLGEAGIGTWTYGAGYAGIGKPYPELVAGCGLIDITGHPDAALLLSQATWGLLDAPQIAVRPLDHAGERVNRGSWRSTDAVQSWSWRGCEGKTAEIEVYSSGDEVELFVNGRSLGRKAAGARRGFVARYRTRYEPGEVMVVGFRSGLETGRSSLHSAQDPRLRLFAEGNELIDDGQALAHVRLEIADADGNVEQLDDDRITVVVSGAGTLAAFGSAQRATTESFVDNTHTTSRGRALAIVRSNGTSGEIVVTATSENHGTATLELNAVARESTVWARQRQ